MKQKRSTPITPRLENLRLEDLIPHPDQETYFPLYDEHKFGQLVESIRANGVETPVIVLPAGNAAGLPGNTLIGGHNRAKAAGLAGLATIPARVRYDLLGASRAEVDEIFLSDNTLRRQLSKLSEARAAVGIYRVRKAQAGKRVYGSVFGDQSLREEIGKIIGMSGRNLGRYLNVLESPPEIQVALEAGKITLVQASRVILLEGPGREELASRLRAGEEPKVVFAAFFPPKDGKHVKPNDAVAAFARSLELAHADLAGRVDDVKTGPVRAHEKQLRLGVKLLGSLLRKLDTAG